MTNRGDQADASAGASLVDQQLRDQQAQLNGIQTALQGLIQVTRETHARAVQHPHQLEDMREECVAIAAKAKRDRDTDPAKKGVGLHLDSIQESLTHLKKARRGLAHAQIAAPVDRVAAELAPHLPFTAEFQLAEEDPALKAVVDAIDKGIRSLERREDQLLVVFNAETNKAGYQAVEASELGDGGGSYVHLDEERKKRVKAAIEASKVLCREAEKKADRDRASKDKLSKGVAQAKPWFPGGKGGPPPPPPAGENSTSVGVLPAPARPGSGGRPPFGSLPCFACNQIGHFARDPICPKFGQN